jgi:ABC-type Fe3+/spermidine/putrescine transport system ATPase subunit
MSFLSVQRVSKSYPGLPVLKEASFEVAPGEIICLLGPSGCGKTTLLRIVAGLEAPDTGSVTLEGRDLGDIPVHRRGFGFMFQDYALFPHMDVASNVAFGLRMQGLPADESANRVREMLDLVALEGYEKRRVVELSGGEQQRVALARSLAPRPRLLMLDEPLGALDRALREQLMNELRAILKRVGVTALYVTHDQEEAFALADRVLIMRARPEQGEGGWIEQEGTPAQVYRYPQTEYVARFLGFRNLLPGEVVDAGDGYRIRTGIGELAASDGHGDFAAGDPATVLIRPEAANLCARGDEERNVVTGTLVAASFRGSYYLIELQCPDDTVLICEVTASAAELPRVGEPLSISLDPRAIVLLRPEQTRARLSPKANTRS